MTIRRATVDDVTPIARVHVESWKTTYRGIMPDELLANLTVEWREAMWQRVLSNPPSTTKVFVAEDENGEIIGFVSGGHPQAETEGFDCELYAIYLLEQAQGKGFGKALFNALVRSLRNDGYTNMLLWVVDENETARQFYEGMGGELLPLEKVETFGGKEVHEVAYGWQGVEC
jgi:ribosomal protein S18 acetylase RimI-like enzyme